MNDFDVLSYSFNNDIDIIPISDVHLGSLECREREWAKFCEDIASKPDTYLMLNGDLLDTGLHNSKTDIYKQRMMPTDACDLMVKYLESIADRILFLVEGNHEHRVELATSFSPTRYIACRLGIEDRYRENAAFCILRFGADDPTERRKLRGPKRPTYTIAAIHGATKTRDKNLGSFVDADICITGHTHAPDVTPKMRYKFDTHNSQMLSQPYYHIVSASWLDWGGYGLAKVYAPAAHCLQVIHLSNNGKNINILIK